MLLNIPLKTFKVRPKVVMDYEGYTFVFVYQNINKVLSVKCDIYFALTFQQQKNLLKMQVTFIWLN